MQNKKSVLEKYYTVIEALNKKENGTICLFLISPVVFLYFIWLQEKEDLYLTARKSGHLKILF